MAETKGFDWGALVGPGISAIGAGLSGAAQGKLSKQQLADQQLMQYRQMLQQGQRDLAASEGGMYQNWLADQYNRSNAVQNARGIGEAQNFESANALRSALFPALMQRANTGIYSPDAGVAAATPKATGINIDPAALQRLMTSWSPETTAQSIAQRDMDIQSLANGQAAGTQGLMGQMYGLGATPLMQQMGDWSTNLYNTATNRETDATNRVRNALEQNIKGGTDYVAEAMKKQQEAQKSGGGFWKTLAGLAPLALNFIPGVNALSIPMQLALKAGTGAASGALTGGGKGAIMGGLGGAASVGTGKLGDLVGSKISNPTLAALTKGAVTGAAQGPAGMLTGAAGTLLQQRMQPRAQDPFLGASTTGDWARQRGILTEPIQTTQLPTPNASYWGNLPKINNPYALNFGGRR